MTLFLILGAVVVLNAFAYGSASRAPRFENRRGTLYPSRYGRWRQRPFSDGEETLEDRHARRAA